MKASLQPTLLGMLALGGLRLFAPAHAAETAGDVCATLGATTLSTDRANIVACMLKTGSTEANPTCEPSGKCV